MERKKELEEYIKNDVALLPLVGEVLFLESQLDYLRQLPFIKIHPSDPTKQKPTPAAKQYKEFLQQYNNCLKILAKASGHDLEDEESPLRKWINSRLKGE